MSWLGWTVATSIGVAALYAAASVIFAFRFTRPNVSRSGTWPLPSTPREEGLDYQDVTFPASDGLRIAGWWLPSRGRTAVVMVPGVGLNRLAANSEARGGKPGALRIAAALRSRGHAVLMYDPRGWGASGESRMSYGSLESRDVEGALDWLAARGHSPVDVAVLAWSMGCAAAMFALEKRAYAGLVADSPLGGFMFDDVVSYVSRKLKVPRAVARALSVAFLRGVFVAGHLLWRMRLPQQPVDRLRARPVPTLVIHGRADRRVPARVGEEVASAAGPHLLGAHFLDGVDHMEAYGADPDWYLETVTDALDRMLARTPATAG
jgi:uncharacterized protein